MKKDKTIARVVARDLCHGCGTCVSLCPLAAIALTRDDRRGIYIPQIDFTICNQCSICLQVCPGHSVDFDQLNEYAFSEKSGDSILGVHINCYSGYSADKKLRYNGASGGMVTTLLLSALEDRLIDGALVTRMNENNPLEPEPFIARTREEIISAARSKYCPVPANIALREILDKEGKYAVVGLPCHIHGIRKSEQVNKTLAARIVLHIGIFCGYTYSFLATDYLLSQQGIHKEDVKAIDYRGEGWPGGASVHLPNGRKIFIPTFELYKTLELSFTPWRCLLCCDGAAELADISCGDAWLPEFSDDKSGTSVIVSRTPRAEAMLKQVAERGLSELKGIGASMVAQSQPWFLSKKTRINLFFRLAGIMRKGIPSYKTNLSKTGLAGFAGAAMLAAGPFIASKRYLWRFIPILHRLSRKMSSIPKMKYTTIFV